MTSSVKLEDNDEEIQILSNPSKAVMILDLSSDDSNDDIDSFQSSKEVINHGLKRERVIKTEFALGQNEPPRKKPRLATQNSIKLEPENTRSRTQKSVDIINKKQVRKAGKNNFTFYKMKSGLNYAGKCCNDNCIAFKQPVIMQKRFGIFEPLKEAENDLIQCPSCETPFEIKGIYLYRTRTKIQSQLLNDNESNTETVIVRDGDYFVFGQKVARSGSNNHNNNNSNKENHDSKLIVNGSSSCVYKSLRFVVNKL